MNIDIEKKIIMSLWTKVLAALNIIQVIQDGQRRLLQKLRRHKLTQYLTILFLITFTHFTARFTDRRRPNAYWRILKLTDEI